MKVLVLTQTLDSRSGWGRYSMEVVRHLEKDGMSVRVLELGNQVTLISFVKNCFLTRQAARYCGIVHAFDGWPYSVYGLWAVFGTGKKLFVSGVGTYSVPMGNLIKVFLMKYAYKRAAEIFAISRYTAKQIKSKVPEANVTVVHMGLTPLPEVSGLQAEELSSKLQIKDYSPLIITVGEIKNRKGQYDTIRAVAKLTQDYPNIGYVLVGKSEDKNYREKIESFIDEHGLRDRVKILSDVTDDETLAFLYKRSDILALNARNEAGHFEGFGLVILEAGQFGKPSIGSTESGIEDAIVDGKTGYLVPQGNTDAIAEAIQKALSLDREEIRKFAQSFEWSSTAKAYVKAYKA